jgi:hypothetical protein
VNELAIHEQTDADPFRDRHGDQVSEVFGVLAEPQFRERACVRSVLCDDRQLDRGLEQFLDVDGGPPEVWREHQPSSAIHAAGKTDAHALANDLGVRRTESGYCSGNFSDERVRILWGRPRRLSNESSVNAGESDRSRFGSQLDGENARPLDIEMEKARASPSRRRSNRTLCDPAFADQLVDDRGNRASLKARVPRKIGTRHRLMPANEIQRDPPIDLPGGLAGRNVEIGEINLAHVAIRERVSASIRSFVRVANYTETSCAVSSGLFHDHWARGSFIEWNPWTRRDRAIAHMLRRQPGAVWQQPQVHSSN